MQSIHRHEWGPETPFEVRYRCSSCGAIGMCDRHGIITARECHECYQTATRREMHGSDNVHDSVYLCDSCQYKE
jgi:transposase-like protein